MRETFRSEFGTSENIKDLAIDKKLQLQDTPCRTRKTQKINKMYLWTLKSMQICLTEIHCFLRVHISNFLCCFLYMKTSQEYEYAVMQ